MGCNCKNKENARPKAIEKKIEPQVIQVELAPPYSWEEVIRVKDYLTSTNKTEEERLNMIDFNEKYFGEKIMGYCDQNCLSRVQMRVELATKLLNEWEEKNKI